MNNALAARDVVSRPWARATWYTLVLWVVAFGASGLLCSAKAFRSALPLQYTGPIFLAGAVATALRAAGVISLSCIIIGAGVPFGVVCALAWERSRKTSSNDCC